MLEKNDRDDLSNNVIGYRRFEALWTGQHNDEEYKWINRMERIFQGLDLRVDYRTDSRIAQLSRLYTHVYALLVELYNIDGGEKPTTADKLSKIPREVSRP
jgi:flagellin-specific chaperone FliS